MFVHVTYIHDVSTCNTHAVLDIDYAFRAHPHTCSLPSPLSLSLSLSLSHTHTHTHIPTEAAEIVRSICLAVAHLHYMNIAHRDLKVGQKSLQEEKLT